MSSIVSTFLLLTCFEKDKLVSSLSNLASKTSTRFFIGVIDDLIALKCCHYGFPISDIMPKLGVQHSISSVENSTCLTRIWSRSLSSRSSCPIIWHTSHKGNGELEDLLQYCNIDCTIQLLSIYFTYILGWLPLGITLLIPICNNLTQNFQYVYTKPHLLGT